VVQEEGEQVSGTATTWGRIKLAMIFWLARRLPDCRATAPYISASLDRRLPLGEQVKLKLHLLACEMCVRYRKQLLFLREAARRQAQMAQTTEDPTAPRLSPEARERLKKMLSGGGE
jgi:hypothetical protein